MTPLKTDSPELRQQLLAFVAMRRSYGPLRLQYRYACIEDFVLQNGRAYRPAKSPHLPIPRMCFQGSYQRAARARSPWIYVEGYAISPVLGLATPHAWLTRADQPDRAFEVAWEKGVEYLGVPFRMEYVRKVFLASQRKYYGVLEAPWINYPLITGQQPVEEVIWKPGRFS